eukprot:7072310-Pyramimonas_sp.AAC.1
MAATWQRLGSDLVATWQRLGSDMAASCLAVGGLPVPTMARVHTTTPRSSFRSRVDYVASPF